MTAMEVLSDEGSIISTLSGSVKKRRERRGVWRAKANVQCILMREAAPGRVCP